MAGPTATVVIATYNRPNLLREALASLERQTRVPDEVIVVDDGSPDPVPILRTPLNLQVIRQENKGAAAAWNRGVQESSGDIIFIQGDDDLFAPLRIEHALQAHQEFEIACCAQVGFAHLATPSPLASWTMESHNDPGDLLPVVRRVSAASLLARSIPSLGATSVAREAFAPLDETYRASQDVEWWVRMASVDLAVGQYNSRDYWVRRHSGERNLNGKAARVSASARILEEHADFFTRSPKAKAFRLARMSLMSSQLGHSADARRYALASVSAHPSGPGLRAGLSAIRSSLQRQTT